MAGLQNWPISSARLGSFQPACCWLLLAVHLDEWWSIILGGTKSPSTARWPSNPNPILLFLPPRFSLTILAAAVRSAPMAGEFAGDGEGGAAGVALRPAPPSFFLFPQLSPSATRRAEGQAVVR
jgi:hypothetical protein